MQIKENSTRISTYNIVYEWNS